MGYTNRTKGFLQTYVLHSALDVPPFTSAARSCSVLHACGLRPGSDGRCPAVSHTSSTDEHPVVNVLTSPLLLLLMLHHHHHHHSTGLFQLIQLWIKTNRVVTTSQEWPETKRSGPTSTFTYCCICLQNLTGGKEYVNLIPVSWQRYYESWRRGCDRCFEFVTIRVRILTQRSVAITDFHVEVPRSLHITVWMALRRVLYTKYSEMNVLK
jgi:hypothetical protein